MHRRLFLVIISAFAVASSAQTLALSGKVSNGLGSPISGAVVTLIDNKVSDTTDAQGMYSLSMMLSINPLQTLHGEQTITVQNGIVSIRLAAPAPVSIEIFNTRGALLQRVDNASMTSGIYRYDLSARHLAAHLLMLRFTIGNHVSMMRYVPLHDRNRTFAAVPSMSQNQPGLARLQAALDSLRVSADGYLRKTAPVATYRDTVNFTLDTLPLAKFSFFVTSLKGIRALSNNPLGFGGDLRFGKTGPGAGLMGADSICQCIAEMSMPGSRIKQWRAFLSVASGPDGKQVNAIDRIGPGPWYDRRGRVVALTVNDLMNSRPLNIDPAIKEDLPNEDGVPNHQPDPNLPAVDNHLTITGSDSLGRLYSPTSTCEDWTNATTTTTSKPRCGLSWTRTGGIRSDAGIGGGGFMNMNNWVSFWDLPGCLAGVDSTDASGAGDPTSKSIGAGGGYGGFYCFSLNP